jgi:hypothetical protein
VRTIYKYAIPFPKDDEKGVVVQMPRNARVLSVGEQNGEIFAWALVESQEMEPRRFWIHGTGHPVSNHVTATHFLGTVHMRGVALVFHVFGWGPT